MPYYPHPCLEEPSDLNDLLWHMDLAKLVSILVDKSLFFPSGRTLFDQKDRFEGQPTYEEVARVNSLALAAPPSPEEMKAYVTHLPFDVPVQGETLADFRKAAPDEIKSHMERIEKISFFNCWHMNHDESDAMWKVYDRGKQGVAIQSTVGKLRSSLAATDKKVYMGKIRYYREPDNSPPNTNIFIWRFMRKRMAFQHEKELRVAVIDEAQQGKPGVKLPVYLDDLIGRVVISPDAESWIAPLVKALASRLGYKFEVVPSEAAGPLPAATLHVDDDVA